MTYAIDLKCLKLFCQCTYISIAFEIFLIVALRRKGHCLIFILLNSLFLCDGKDITAASKAEFSSPSFAKPLFPEVSNEDKPQTSNCARCKSRGFHGKGIFRRCIAFLRFLNSSSIYKEMIRFKETFGVIFGIFWEWPDSDYGVAE